MRLKRQLCIAGSFFLCALWFSLSAYAVPFGDTNTTQQQKGGNFGKIIKGKITDVNNEPIIGASVRIKDQNVGTITDIDGNFSLIYKGDAPKDILVSFVGYLGKAVRYTGQANLNVTLEEDVKLLNEVVVTGYQTISKERATGAFAILNNQAIEKTINIGIKQALEGQIAGVTTYGGDVVIRGRSTVSNAVGTNPLLVIDGLPTERSIDDININDVESMTVLKDAAATSIYGSRAANGVIVITTKIAEKGKMRINFTADWKWEENPTLADYHYLSTEKVLEYEPLLWERSATTPAIPLTVDQWVTNQNYGYGSASGSYVSPLMAARMRLASNDMSQADYNAYVKELGTYDYRQAYMDALWRTPFRQNYNLTISNASDRQNTYASITYTGDALQMKTNDKSTIKANIKTTQNVAKWLSVDLGLDAQYGRSEEAHPSTTFENQMTTFNPYNKIYNQDGSLSYLPYAPNAISGAGTMFTAASFTPNRLQGMYDTGAFESMNYNIMDEVNRAKNTSKSLMLRAFTKFNFKITKDLKFSTSYDYEVRKESLENYVDKNNYFMRLWRNRLISRTGAGTTASPYVYTQNMPGGSYLMQKENSRINYTFRNQLDYSKTFAEKHSVSVLAGMEMREVKNPLGVTAISFGYDPQTLSIATPPTLNPTLLVNTGITSPLFGNTQKLAMTLLGENKLTEIKHRYLSYYGAAGYTFNNLYNLSASVRVDQTDLFGTDPKYRYRPLWSLGAGWNISNEKFMKELTWVDMLTLRGSYGITGNVDQTSSPYIRVVTSNSSIATMDAFPTATLSGTPNPLLRWEKTTSYALGADFSLFKGYLSGKIEGYYKYSDDLLVPSSLPYASGVPSATINNGAISNKGIEITLSSTWYKKNNLRLSSTLVYAYNKNKVEKVYRIATSADLLIRQPYAYYKEGDPFNALYAYHCEGLRTDGSDMQNGLPIFRKADGTEYYSVSADGRTVVNPGTLAPEEAVYMGTLDPKWSGSFTQTIQYKNFELSALVTFYGGHKIRKPSYEFIGPGTSSVFHGAWSEDLANGWTKENPTSTLPKSGMYYTNAMTNMGVYGLTNIWRYSDANVVDGDMVRLKNVSLSYTLPQKYASAAKLTRVKLTGQVNNLWFWCAAGNDVDPETYTTTQINASAYKTPNAIDRTLPLMTSYLLRLEVTF